MADMRTFLTFAGLSHYDEKIKTHIANADLVVMGKVSEAQAEIDALEKLVGALPEGTTAKDVIEYINLKTTGIATTEALAQMQLALDACQEAVDAIEADYLKAADKTELSNAITAEADRAKGIEGDLETRLAAVEADYLVEADKTELSGLITAEENARKEAVQGVQNAVDTLSGTHTTDKAALEAAIALKADQTALEAVSGVANAAVKQADYDVKVKALDDEDARIAGLVASEKERAELAEKANADAIKVLNGEGEGSVKKSIDDAFNKFATDVTNDDVVNSYKELIDWAAEHGAEAAEMVAAIEDNADAIAALSEFVGTLPEGETSETVVAFIQKLVNAEKSRAEGVESGHATRIEALETAVGTSGGKSVAEQIESAVSEVQTAVDELSDVVDTKADSSVVEAIDGRVETAEGEIDQLQTDVAAAQEQADKGVEDAAAALKAAQDASSHADELNTAMNTRVEALEAIDHTHDNKDVLDGITAAKVSAWDAAEANAKSHADGLNSAMDTRMGAVEGKASANETAISGLQQTHATDKAALEASIQALDESLVEITTAQIDGLFA